LCVRCGEAGLWRNCVARERVHEAVEGHGLLAKVRSASRASCASSAMRIAGSPSGPSASASSRGARSGVDESSADREALPLCRQRLAHALEDDDRSQLPLAGEAHHERSALGRPRCAWHTRWPKWRLTTAVLLCASEP
jgi:hypothetical protein